MSGVDILPRVESSELEAEVAAECRHTSLVVSRLFRLSLLIVMRLFLCEAGPETDMTIKPKKKM